MGQMLLHVYVERDCMRMICTGMEWNFPYSYKLSRTRSPLKHVARWRLSWSKIREWLHQVEPMKLAGSR